MFLKKMLTVLAGCAWEPQCLTLMTKVSVNASPAQSALSPSSSSVCLLVCQSEHTHRLASSAVTLHLISSSNPGLDFSALFLSASLPALVMGHSFHTQLNEPFKT